jgi:SAM-dependent methyltransferase
MDQTLFQEMRNVQSGHWWFQSRLSIIEELLNKYTVKQRPQLRLIEIGAGVGVNAGLLRQYGELTLVECSDSAIGILEKDGYSVVKGFLPDVADKLGSRFDVILLIDVLEHIENDREALLSLKQLMGKDSLLIMTVPAFMFLWSAHDEVHAHYRRYERSSLMELLHEAGYNIELVSYYNMILFPFVFLARTIKKMTGSKKHDLARMPYVLNMILRLIFSCEKHLVARTGLPFGSSLCVVAKKRKLSEEDEQCH